MRIAITGASGNVGTALLRRLAGHELVGICRRPPGEGAYAGAARWHAIDLSAADSTGPLTEALRGADAVVHLAWGFQPTHDERYLERLGVGGTRRVLRAAADAGVGHVVHMSSLGAYSPGDRAAGSDPEYVDESWPTDGVPNSAYSRHKVAAERLLDSFEPEHAEIAVTRVRPTLIGQRTAASALLRYLLPGVVPHRALALLRVLPLDRRLRLQFVHADDVAEAYRLILESRTPGAFNLAAEPTLGPRELAAALGAVPVHLPFGVLRVAAATTWRLRLQQVDAGWLDMARRLPLLDAGRARGELGWAPAHDALGVVREVVEGVRSGAYDDTVALRPRHVGENLAHALRGRPVSERHAP